MATRLVIRLKMSSPVAEVTINVLLRDFDTARLTDHAEREVRGRAAVLLGDALERLGRLADARAAIDDLAVSTDIIVGFPGETDDEFADSKAFVAATGFYQQFDLFIGFLGCFA